MGMGERGWGGGRGGGGRWRWRGGKGEGEGGRGEGTSAYILHDTTNPLARDDQAPFIKKKQQNNLICGTPIKDVTITMIFLFVGLQKKEDVHRLTRLDF